MSTSISSTQKKERSFPKQGQGKGESNTLHYIHNVLLWIHVLISEDHHCCCRYPSLNKKKWPVTISCRSVHTNHSMEAILNMPLSQISRTIKIYSIHKPKSSRKMITYTAFTLHKLNRSNHSATFLGASMNAFLPFCSVPFCSTEKWNG